RGTACSSPHLPHAAFWLPRPYSPVELRRPRVRLGQGRSATSTNTASCIGCWGRPRRPAPSGPRPVRCVEPAGAKKPCPWRSGSLCLRRRQEAVPGSQSGSSRCALRILALRRAATVGRILLTGLVRNGEGLPWGVVRPARILPFTATVYGPGHRG